MTDLDALLTGRQLVNALADLGVGRWSPDAVRQWTREEPPAPIAEHADQGKPHRYQLRTVLVWLRDRAQRERAKGFTRGDGAGFAERVNAALAGMLVSAGGDVPPLDQPGNFAASDSRSAGAGGAASNPPAEVSPAKAPQQTDWLQLSDVEALLQVLQGRDPRNWKAAEEAMTTRRERLEAERKLIPIDELELALETHTEHTRRGIDAARQSTKQRLRDFVRPERLHDAERAIDKAFEGLLQRLAETDDLEPAAPAPSEQ